MSEALCGRPATGKMYWPGRDPLFVCEEHGLQARAIARAMGFHLVIEAVHEEGGVCSQSVRRS